MSNNKITTTNLTTDRKTNKNSSTNGNGTKKMSEVESLEENYTEPKSYKSAMKAFEMTHRRLHPELYKTQKKRD